MEYIILYFTYGFCIYALFALVTWEFKGCMFTNNKEVRYHFLFVFLSVVLWPMMLLIDIYVNYLAPIWKRDYDD